MEITAKAVAALRAKTGIGMMDCKKALVEANGNEEEAIKILREKGLAVAAKKASRIAAEGLVVSYVSEDAKVGVIVEVNCETDFVAKTENFQELVAGIAAHVAKSNPADMEALNASEIEAGKTVAALITESIAKIGENISLRRFARYEVAEGMVAAYIHGGGKIGVLVSMTAGSAELGHDVAMHIAAANPGYLNREQVPTAELEHEKAVLTEQARNEGKPEKIIEKMVLGRIQKYYKEVCLVDQEFVKDPDQTVGKLVAAAGASVTEFTRFQLGEGIEKKQEDFAAEVMAQIK